MKSSGPSQQPPLQLPLPEPPDPDALARAEFKRRFCERINTGPEGPATADALLAIAPTIRRLMKRFGLLAEED